MATTAFNSDVTCGALGATSLTVASGTTVARIVSGTAAIDLASVAAGAVSSVTATLTGATAGDAVFVNPGSNWSGQYNHLTLVPFVSAANEVTILVSNQSAGAIDAASSTFRLTAFGF